MSIVHVIKQLELAVELLDSDFALSKRNILELISSLKTERGRKLTMDKDYNARYYERFKEELRAKARKRRNTQPTNPTA